MWQKAVPFDSSRTSPLRACNRRTGLPFCEVEEEEEEEEEQEEESDSGPVTCTRNSHHSGPMDVVVCVAFCLQGRRAQLAPVS